jgi:hypothetical protein
MQNNIQITEPNYDEKIPCRYCGITISSDESTIDYFGHNLYYRVCPKDECINLDIELEIKRFGRKN